MIRISRSFLSALLLRSTLAAKEKVLTLSIKEKRSLEKELEAAEGRLWEEAHVAENQLHEDAQASFYSSLCHHVS
ncbi:hypothetical protein QVD17_08951 [Tagetes erecta]|uniref:Uncharacterized protein n=1 Tax=Tagetes erecta TaxID=13708 RepID=A0AAD8P4V0_TARER|nr:hypothetical protein QVD17_08951 [Tagetes erecta]